MELAQHAGRIDHVVIVVKSENLEEAVVSFNELLEIELEGPFEPPGLGTAIYMDWQAGVMLVSPIDEAIAKEQAEFLEVHGEGIFRLVFGVADRSVALDRAAKLKYATAWLYDGLTVSPDWKLRYKRIDEGIITPPLHGVRINFSQIEPV